MKNLIILVMSALLSGCVGLKSHKAHHKAHEGYVKSLAENISRNSYKSIKGEGISSSNQQRLSNLERRVTELEEYRTAK